MTPAAIIASAWASEREKYVIRGADERNLWLEESLYLRWATPLCQGTEEACQAHLDQLCAAAAERALKAAGYAVVPVEPTEAMLDNGMNADEVMGDWSTSARENTGLIYRAMLAALEE